MTIVAPEGKKYIVANVNSGIEFGTIVTEKGITYDVSQGGFIDLKEVASNEALLKILVKEGIESVKCNFTDIEGNKEVEIKYPGEATYVCKIGSKYTWSAEVKEGYNCSKSSGKGEVSEESNLIVAKGSIKKFKLSITMDEHIKEVSLTINSNPQETIKDKEFEKEVSYGDIVSILPTMEDGFEIKDTFDSIHVFDNVSFKLKSAEIPKDSPIIPVVLKVEGDWNYKAHISGTINISGLKFFVIYSDGSKSEVTDVNYPNNWGDEVGEQECSFIYIYGGISVIASKKAYVYPKEVTDKFGNVFFMDKYSRLCGIKSIVSDKLEIPEFFLGFAPKALSGNCGVRHLIIHDSINTIPESTFEGNTDIKDITFKCRYPFKIGKRAFFGCSNLEFVDFLACGDKFKESIIGDGIVRDVWEGCNNLSIVKITQGNFSKSLDSVSFHSEDSCRKDMAIGPVLKYNLTISGESVERDGILFGNPFVWQVSSCDYSGKLSKALLYKSIPRIEGSSLIGKICFYEEGDYLKEYKDAAKINKWSFKETGFYESDIQTGLNNKVDVSFEVLGLGSEEFDYSKVKDCGYIFRTFKSLGISGLFYDVSSKSFKVSDVLYPNLTLDGHNCLDYLRPLI